MKPIRYFGILLAASTLHAQTSTQTPANNVTLPAATPYAAVSRDASSTVWQRTTYQQAPDGSIVPQVHRYTELSAGLNRLVAGQWQPSSETISISPDGNSASGTNCAHQIYFPGDIYNGVIKLVEPGGQVIETAPMALALSDGDNSVLLAVVTNATGAILPSGNQVIYQNAFAGLTVDLLYRNTKAGLEQDVVLHIRLPDPAVLGLNPEKTRLQMITEFVSSPQPNITPTTVLTDAGNLEDDNLSFGAMQMAQGKAFQLGANSLSVEVNKRWLNLNGRQFLIEEVPMVSIAKDFESLPPFAGQTNTRATFVISKNLVLPPKRLVTTSPTTKFAAKATAPTQGLMLDYVILNSYTNNFVFQGDTTYYINGTVNLTGTSANTFEGGAVIKYARGAYIWLSSPSNWKDSAYRPIIFTAMDDNSVGEVITNSTGNPTNYYASPALLFSKGGLTLQNVRIAYASIGLQTSYSPLVIRDSQFVNVSNAVKTTGNSLNLENVLMYNVSGTALYAFGTGANCVAQNLTAHNANSFFYQGAWSTLALTNSLLVACTNSITGFTGAYNYITNNAAGIFQAVGAGAHYLATNCPAGILSAGTTNIDPALLADLLSKTVWPPLVYSNVTITNNLVLGPVVPRDTGPMPTLGYHYDPLDYVVGGVDLDATMTVNPGTAIAFFNYLGWCLYFDGYGQFSSQGTATAPNRMVEYNAVQESSWGSKPSALLAAVEAGSINCQFTDFSIMANDAYAAEVEFATPSFNFRDCQFQGGQVGELESGINFFNCLFDRVAVQMFDNGSLSLGQSLFWGGSVSFDSGSYPVYNTAFDGTALINLVSSSAVNHNAYINATYSDTNNGDLTLTNFVFATGPLGNFYQASTNLLGAGNTNAGALGLGNYTVLTNQAPDTNTVDIGYHYKIVGNDSTGTDFWLTFFDTQTPPDYANFQLSLYISSSMTTSGTVNYRVNGPLLTVMGDPAVNGTYMQTNASPAETNNFPFVDPILYVNVTKANLQVVFRHDYGQWFIESYTNDILSNLYYKRSSDLNVNDWFGNGPGVTSSCPYALSIQPFFVAAGAVTNVPIPLTVMLDQYDAVENKAIHVTAQQPVSVYGFDYLVNASSAFTTYPIPMLGTNYCVMARASQYYYTTYSQFAILATVDDTTVTIVPSSTANLVGHPGTGPYTNVLNQGDSYEINSSGTYDDVTGTRIISDKPIAVFAGDNDANVPDGNTEALNPLVQEQLPVEQWGTNVVAMFFAGRTNGDSYRILSAESNTVTITGTIVTNLIENNPPWTVMTNYETVTSNLMPGVPCDIIVDGPVWFQAKQPIQVAKFANGTWFDNLSSDENPNEGDPCEVLLLPVGRFLASYLVFTPPNNGIAGDFDENFLNIIAPPSATNSTWVDGSLIASTNFMAIGTSGYYGTQVSVTNGVHTVTSSQPVGVEAYGWGQADAYGYFGGVVK